MCIRDRSLSSSVEYNMYIYLGNICGSCLDGVLVFKLDSIQTQMKNGKINILLPNEYSRNDLENIKYNHSFKIDFYNIGLEFQEIIKKTKYEKNRFPFSGFCFVVNREGLVLHSDYLFSKKIPIKKKLDIFWEIIQ